MKKTHDLLPFLLSDDGAQGIRFFDPTSSFAAIKAHSAGWKKLLAPAGMEAATSVLPLFSGAERDAAHGIAFAFHRLKQNFNRDGIMSISENSGIESLNLLQAESALAAKIASPSTAHAAAGESKAADMKRWKTSLDFQTMFLTQMYKSMRQTVGHNDLTQPSFARNIYMDMFDQQVAASPANSPLESGTSGLSAAQNGTSNSLAAEIYRSLQQSGRNVTPADFAGLKSTPAAAASSGTETPLSQNQLNPLVQEAAAQYAVPPNLIRSVIQAESGNHPSAISSKGAKGLMQLTDTTAAEMGVANPFDPRQNILGGAHYLRTLLDRYQGNENQALAGYNAGPAAVDRFGGVPPFAETQQYVSRVQKIQASLDQGESP